MKHNTIIIGAGITGLVIANELMDKGIDPEQILILEKENRAGGLIATSIEDGFSCEWGPEGLRGSSTNTHRVFELAGIEKIASTEQAKIRYILKKGKLISLPTNPIKAIFSSVLSPFGKLRLLMEPFVSPVDTDESIATFFERRFGKGVLPLVDAFVSGIFGGNPSKLSIEHSFPPLKRAERLKGSVIRGLMAMKKGTGQKGKRNRQPFLFTPSGGMQQLLKQLSEKVNVVYGMKVKEIKKLSNGFIILTDQNEWQAEKVVVATGIQGICNIKIEGNYPSLKPEISKVSIVSMGFTKDSFRRPPKGYGFLIPESEKKFLLGVLFTSNLFPQKAPQNTVLLRCFVGGERHEDRALMDKEELIAKVQEEVTDLLEVTKPPVYISIQRHAPKGIPQLNLDHEFNLNWKHKIEKKFPNLYFAGIGWTSISCDGLISEAIELAQKLTSSNNDQAMNH